MNEKTILLIEDNPDDIELTLRAFRKINLKNKIIVISDGAEAIEYLSGEGKHAGRNINDLPAVVLLDLKLPKVNGLEILKSIRSWNHTRLLPVVILTTSGEERDLVDSYNYGANSYMRKPVDFNQFIDAIQKFGFYWLLLNESPKL
jgi:CheY-like chemotaxis protein